MFRRIIALTVLLLPLGLVTAAPTAGASGGSPPTVDRADHRGRSRGAAARTAARLARQRGRHAAATARRTALLRRGYIDASTGSGGWYYSQGRWARVITPTGRFHVYWRYNGWQAGPLGSLYRPNYFYGGYAVHGMTSVPAYPASHGCVRMTVPTMDRMWSSLWIGMPVAIYRS